MHWNDWLVFPWIDSPALAGLIAPFPTPSLVSGSSFHRTLIDGFCICCHTWRKGKNLSEALPVWKEKEKKKKKAVTTPLELGR